MKGSDRERGAVAVIVAIVMVSMVGMTALVVDAGLAYQERRQTQTAVDAGAMAAAQELGEGGSQAAATGVASQYVAANTNVPPSELGVTFPTETEVRVEAKTDRQAMFARIFGLRQLRVGADATARFGVASTTVGVVPFMVPHQMVSSHIGSDNAGSFELGSDRPAEAFRKTSATDGSVITYEIVYVNTGSHAKEVTLRDTLPKDTEYIDGSASESGDFEDDEDEHDSDKHDDDHNGGEDDHDEVRWTKNLAAGEEWDVSFRARKKKDSVPANTAYARGSTGPEESATENDESQRGFFWLADFSGGGAGTSDYENWIINGYQQDISVDEVANGTGMRAALKDALAERMDIDPSIIVPLYDYTEGSGAQGSYHVKGFAEFVITDFKLKGNPKTITGYFTTGTVVGGSTGGDAIDFGVSAVGLVD